MKLICNDCKSIFNNDSLNTICPKCNSVNIEILVNDINSEIKNYIVYYNNFNKMRIMHKDSHFYSYNRGDIISIKNNNDIRYFTEFGAKNSIKGIKDKHPEWDLQMIKID